MHRKYIATGILCCGLAVALGAFGAHGLQKLTTDEKILNGYHTGVQYQFWHGLALILTGILFPAGFSGKRIRWAATCFFTGILFFSGSLYLLTFLKINNSGMTRVIGPVTPAGGILFIAGWLLLLAAVMNKKEAS
ncbi:MAG: DUF423 domain-containing protein [Chitinophagaceae bacterium]